MKPSNNCVNIIKQFEGLRLDSYRDIAGVWTIGYGSTHGVTPEQHITEQDADEMLMDELTHVAGVLSAAITFSVNQNQFDACCSLAYNIGCTAFTGSTLLKKINANDMAGAADEFTKWDHSGGQIVQGLLNRRIAEQWMFLGENFPDAA